MAQFQDQGPGAHSLLIFLFALFMLASPFTSWWMNLTAPWYFTYLLWLIVIGLTWVLARKLRRHVP